VWTHRIENARRAAYVISVWVRKHERLERATAPKHVGEHCRATRIAATPGGACVEQYPVAAIRSNQDRVTLSDIEDMELDAVAS